MLTRDNFETLRKVYTWRDEIKSWCSWYTPKNIAYTMKRLPYKDRVVLAACLRHAYWYGVAYYYYKDTEISDIMSEISSVERQLSQSNSFVVIKFDNERMIDWVYTISIKDGSVLDYYSRQLM